MLLQREVQVQVQVQQERTAAASSSQGRAAGQEQSLSLVHLSLWTVRLPLAAQSTVAVLAAVTAAMCKCPTFNYPLLAAATAPLHHPLPPVDRAGGACICWRQCLTMRQC